MAYGELAKAQDYQRNIATACEPSPTAAQEALSAAERVSANLRELNGRLSALADRLTGGGPATNAAKEQPRPVRGGIIGSIHSTIDGIEETAQRCHDLMNDIERRV